MVASSGARWGPFFFLPPKLPLVTPSRVGKLAFPAARPRRLSPLTRLFFMRRSAFVHPIFWDKKRGICFRDFGPPFHLFEMPLFSARCFLLDGLISKAQVWARRAPFSPLIARLLLPSPFPAFFEEVFHPESENLPACPTGWSVFPLFFRS